MVRLKVFLVVTFVAVLSGCSAVAEFVTESPQTARAAVEAGTLAYIDQDAEKAVDLIETLRAGKERIEAGATASIAELDGQLRDALGFQEMRPAKQILLNEFLRRIRVRLEERIGYGALEPDDKVVLITGIDWAIKAAELYAP